MKRTLCLLLIMALIFTACGSPADELARLEEERDNLLEIVAEQNREITSLQLSLTRLERQHNSETIRLQESLTALRAQYDRINSTNRQLRATVDSQHAILASDERRDEILSSFMEQLDWVASFLGIDDLYIADEDIFVQGSIVTARTSYLGNGVVFTLRSWTSGEEIRWALLEYFMGPFNGPGPLDAGRSFWRWQWSGGRFDENFTMRFYRHSVLDVYEYFDEEIAYENWQEQVINHMLTHTGIRIADLWYEGTRLVVDLTPAGALPFNWGTTGSAMHGRSLRNSLATLPNVTEIETLVGGQRGVGTDHFQFGAFRID